MGAHGLHSRYPGFNASTCFLIAAWLLPSLTTSLYAQTPSVLEPAWVRTFAVRSGFGYKDNVLYSPFRAVGSPFYAPGADAIFSFTSDTDTRLTLFLSADETRYFSAAGVDDELLAFAQAGLKKRISDTCELSGALDYLYNDQVLDVSVIETTRLPLPVRGHGGSFRGGARFSLPREWWLAFEPGATRQYYDPIDDYWDFGPRFTLSVNPVRDTEFALRYEINTRRYDHDPRLTEAGFPVDGTVRTFLFQDVRVTWRQMWDSSQHWQTTTRLGYRHNDDQGEDYFSYHRINAAQGIRWRGRKLSLAAEARIAYYTYEVQRASVEDRSRRRRTELVVTLRGEYELVPGLKVIAAFEHEPTYSNDPLERYTADTVSGGVEFEM